MKTKDLLIITLLGVILFRGVLLVIPKETQHPVLLFLIIVIPVLLIVGFTYMLIMLNFRRKESNLTNDKKVILRGGANCYGSGGYLILTSDQLIFKSHFFNAQKYSLRINLNDITDIKAIEIMGVPKGLLVTDQSTVHQFIVNKRNKWFNQIEQLMRK